MVSSVWRSSGQVLPGLPRVLEAAGCDPSRPRTGWTIAVWFTTSDPRPEGLTPAEVPARGHSDRVLGRARGVAASLGGDEVEAARRSHHQREHASQLPAEHLDPGSRCRRGASWRWRSSLRTAAVADPVVGFDHLGGGWRARLHAAVPRVAARVPHRVQLRAARVCGRVDLGPCAWARGVAVEGVAVEGAQAPVPG